MTAIRIWVDDVEVCLVGGVCEREAGHDGSHVYAQGCGRVSVAGAVDVVEIEDLEARLHDEVLCELDAAGHADPCSIVATHRLRITCPPSVTVNVCRVVVEIIEAAPTGLCESCKRPNPECWVVIPL